MASLTVSGIVRLTSDAEARKSKTGTYYTFGIAAYRKFKREGKQDVDFFDATIYTKNPTASLEASLKKGQLMFIEGGNLYNEKFMGNDGKEKSKVKVHILAYEFFNPTTESKETTVAKDPVVIPKTKVEVVPEPEDYPVDEEEPPF